MGRQSGGLVIDKIRTANVARSNRSKFLPKEGEEQPVANRIFTPGSLIKLGSIMGSGGMVVMDEQTNMVDVARFYMQFYMEESCGKCIPCRAGTVEMYKLLTKIVGQRGTLKDLEQLEELCDLVKNTSLSGLGKPLQTRSPVRFAISRTNASSYLKSPYFKPHGYPDGIYRVGPLARLNKTVVEHRRLTRNGPNSGPCEDAAF